ncbi:MAG: hypothetical protein HC893_15440 [Chloroflexaceae bacterium]|nr:hypothetical protein [Chloroflexaceae bacterium]NJL34979.1 hypothetical protein [Chloroflexaceae bacterium]NJO05593.1 hypothetical protein [Chloroflexaceae bacterium]
MKRIKGMRDVPTMMGRGRNGRQVEGNREQIAAELARMEYARARLEREHEIWLRNQQRTAALLEETKQRIALLRQRLNAIAEELEQHNPHPSPPGRLPLRATRIVPRNDDDPNWHEVTFEY